MPALLNKIRKSGPIMLVVWGLLLVFFLVSLVLGRWSLAFVSMATLVLALAPVALASRLEITLPLPFLLATTTFIFGSIFMGETLDFYERVWWWDIALHGMSAVGFGMIGFLFVFMLFEGDRFAAPPSALALITFCIAMTVGAMWEIFEFAMDFTFGLSMQKSGLNDTMGDIIVDALGAGTAAVSGYFYLRGHASGIFASAITQFVERNKRLYEKSKTRLKR